MKHTELIMAKSFGIAAVAYSFINSREEVCLPSFGVVNCLLK